MKERQLKLFQERQEDKDSTGNNRTIMIPIDTLILTSIIILFVIIFSFSLGVKRGKGLSGRITKHKDRRLTIRKKVAIKTALNDNKKEIQEPPGKNNQKTQDNKDENKYVIQVASYLKENLAEKERKNLNDKGLSAEISKKGKYVVLYVGRFVTKEEAEKIKTSLKKRYSDCFIRRL